MNDKPETKLTYKGFQIVYEQLQDYWYVPHGPPGVGAGKLNMVQAQIDQWEIQKAQAGAVKVWLIYDTLQVRVKPKDWRSYTAVFRSTDPGYRDRQGERVKLSWSANEQDYLHLHDCGRCDLAVDSPETEAAMNAARKAYDAYIKAFKKWEAAYEAIPRMTREQWQALPEVGKLEA